MGQEDLDLDGDALELIKIFMGSEKKRECTERRIKDSTEGAPHLGHKKGRRDGKVKDKNAGS